MRNFQDKYLGLSKLIMNFWLPITSIYTVIASYFWSGAGSEFFSLLLLEGSTGAEQKEFFGGEGQKEFAPEEMEHIQV